MGNLCGRPKVLRDATAEKPYITVHEPVEVRRPVVGHNVEAAPCALPGAPGAQGPTVSMPGPPAASSWQRGRQIGQGGFGTVYMGLVHATGQEIAVKQVSLPREAANIGKVMEQARALEREVAVLQQLQHENIVRYLGTERTAEHLNIFLEYVAGGSLSNKLSQFGPLREETIRVYTKQILRGVQYLHQHRVMHRDIKGANILVDTNGVVKLADFGASKQLEDLTTVAGGPRSIHGTPHWMAPEVIRQQGHDCQADIWSLGCVVIEMATGRPPWADVNKTAAVLYHIASTQEPPPMPDSLSSQAREFLSQCFHREPSQRPSATQLLEHPWMQGVAVPCGLGPAQAAAQSAAPSQQAKPPPAFSLLLRSIKEESDTDSVATGGSSRTPPSGEAFTGGTNLPSVNSLPGPMAGRLATGAGSRPVHGPRAAGPGPQRPAQSTQAPAAPGGARQREPTAPASQPPSSGDYMLDGRTQAPEAAAASQAPHDGGVTGAVADAVTSLTGNLYDSISCYNPLDLIPDSFMPTQDPAQLAFLQRLAAIPEHGAPSNDRSTADAAAPAAARGGSAGGDGSGALAAPVEGWLSGAAPTPPLAHAPAAESAAAPIDSVPRRGAGAQRGTAHGTKTVVVPSRPPLAGIFAAAYEDQGLHADGSAAAAANAVPDGEFSPRDQAPKHQEPAPRQRASASRRALQEAGILGGTLDLARAKQWREELQAERGGSLRGGARPAPYAAGTWR